MSKLTNPAEPAIAILQKDPVLEKIITLVGPLEIQHHPKKEILSDIIDTIISQQLSVKAATTIFNRFQSIFPDQTITTKQILRLSEPQMRACGISSAKARYIKAVAEEIESGNLVLADLFTLSDEQVIQRLTELPGIGNWSAEMIMMFCLNRPDIFSVGDAGIQAAVSYWYQIDRTDKQQMIAISQNWQPYRTYGCRYLWKSIPLIKQHAKQS